MTDLNIVGAMFDQIVNNPSSLLLIIVLSIFAWLIEVIPQINSKFVPHVCVALGALFYWAFISASTVPPNYSSPQIVLVANGIICGFIAFIAHGQIVMRLVKLFGAKPAPPEDSTKVP